MTADLDIIKYLTSFNLKNKLSDFGKVSTTEIDDITINNKKIKRFTNEFWTSKQRQSSSLHEISYRACFKAELPNFFVRLLTKENDIVYDPFSGRGTTAIESALLGRNIIANDINPLSKIFIEPRINIPSLNDIEKRLAEIKIDYSCKADINISMFYENKTEAEIISLKNYLTDKKNKGSEDETDKWIRMVATNRLTGHSKGYFSVYTLPPNQAITPERQIKINQKLNQKPEYRNVKQIILKKSKSLLRNLTSEQINNLKNATKNAIILTSNAKNTEKIKSNSVDLVVTSPPFLNIVDYTTDNWLRCWFNNIDAEEISEKLNLTSKIESWTDNMQAVLKELHRIVKPNGWVAFEVGELNNGKIKLDESIVPLGINTGFSCLGVIINKQNFTKTSNIWGIKNNSDGTNTNRIVLFKKDR